MSYIDLSRGENKFHYSKNRTMTKVFQCSIFRIVFIIIATTDFLIN